MSPEETREAPRPGQRVTWLEQRKWGGKQAQPATFLFKAGKRSARIKVDGGKNRTVRLTSLRWESE